MPVAVAILAGLAALAYAPAWRAPFIFDDRKAIVENPHVQSLWPPAVPFGAPPRSILSGRPLPAASFALNYAVGGLDPRGYRAANVALHVLAAVVVFALVRATPPAGDASWPALAIAAIWLVHPLQTEAVTYVTQRTELMAALFYLLTLLAALRDRPVVAVVACALGMLSKEVMVTAPLAVVLYERAFRFPSFAAALRAHGRRYAALAATWAVMAASLLLVPRHESIGAGAGMTPWDYARTEAGVVVAYLRLVLWPVGLSIDHGVWVARGWAEVFPPALVVATLAVATVVAFRRAPAIGFLGAFFFLVLVPTSSVVPIRTEVMAERRMYLPLAAVVVAAVLGGARIVRRPRLRVAMVAVVVVVLGVLTARRNAEYTSELVLWQGAVRVDPGNARAHNNVGTLLLADGRADEAASEFERALAIDPRYAEARYNVGTAQVARGRLDDAAASFAAAFALDPDLIDARYNLATVRLHQGRFDEAIAGYEDVLRRAPGHPGATTNLRVARAALAARSAPAP